MNTKTQSTKNVINARIATSIKRLNTAKNYDRLVKLNKDTLSLYEESKNKDIKPFFFTEESIGKNRNLLRKDNLVNSVNSSSSSSFSRGSLNNNTDMSQKIINNTNDNRALLINNTNRDNKNRPTSKEQSRNQIIIQDECKISRKNDGYLQMNMFLPYNKNEQNISKQIENLDTKYTNLREDLKSIEIIRKNLNLNETYDLEYNNPIHPEEKDKVIFDDLNTHKFKEKIQICLKEQLNSPFLMDEFYKNKYNKVNFLYDNFYVPQIQNKLNFLNLDSVLFLLNQEKSLFKI